VQLVYVLCFWLI